MKNKRNIDCDIKENKNKAKISFSWGYEYRYLVDLSIEVLELISSKFSVDKNKLHLIRTPSVSAYKELDDFFQIKNSFRITPELVCIEGDIKKENMLYQKGTLSSFLPGQSYLDAIYNLENDIEIPASAADDNYHKRIDLDNKIRQRFSKMYNLSAKQIAFNWGSGGSIELILWALKNKLKRSPKVLFNIPNYYYMHSLAEKFGYKVNPVLSYLGGKYHFPLKTLLKELKSNGFDLIVLTSPNNPWGVPIDKGKFYELLKNLPDDTYAMIDFTGLSDENMAYFHDVLNETGLQDKRIFMLDSLSKKYEMCHVRAGYIIGSNEFIFDNLRIHDFSPVLTGYCYQKFEEALDNPSIKKAVLEKHRKLFGLLKSVENRHFQLVSPQFSNFIISRLGSKSQVNKLIHYLSQKYNYYDLPFRGIGKFSKGEGSMQQDFIQYLPQNCLRILEETAEFIAEAVKSLFG